MILYKGIALPDGEKHLIEWMEATGQVHDGRPAYQKNKYDAVLPYVRHRRMAVDVGGNIGQWSRMMAADFAWVTAFEPVPAYVECFSHNTQGRRNIILHRVALGKAAGTVGMRCPDATSHGDTWVARPGDVANAAQDVPLRPLDSYGLADVDLIKVDCEGYEFPVLEGARETLQRCRPVVIVEQKPGKGRHFGYDDHEAIVFLQRLGMVVCKEISGDYILNWGGGDGLR